jgi:hypothetical protein
MDTKQLETELNVFFQTCKEKGYDIEKFCLIENETDFTLEVKSKWIDAINSCSEVLDILLPILLETTSFETRKKIFAISVLDSNEQPQCYEELTVNN